MSNELISALEDRVSNAVDTIEGLRTENRVLKEERQRLEEQLRQLLQKIETSDGISATTPMSTFSNPEPEEESTSPVERPGMGMGPSLSEF